MDQLSNKVTNGGASAAGRLASPEWNQAAKELEEVIESVGQTLNSGDTEQLIKAIVRISQGYGYWGTDTGAANAYVVGSLFSGFTALGLFVGMTIKFRPANNSTVTNPTANVFGTGAITVLNEQGGALSVGDFSTSRDAEMRYDGTNWRLLDRSIVPLVSGLFPAGYIYGYHIENGTDSDHDINFGAGFCASQAATLNLNSVSTVTKQIDATWAAGNNAGGRPAAVALSGNTWYRLFVIGGASAAIDFGFDTSITASNLLSAATIATGNSYTHYRQIGWVVTDVSQNILPFYHDAEDYSRIYWSTPISSASGTGPTHDTRILYSVTAPPFTNAILSARIRGNSSNLRDYIVDINCPDHFDLQPSLSNFVLHASNNGSGNCNSSGILQVLTNSSSQIAARYRETNAGDLSNMDYDIACRGYVYKRGSF